MRCHIMCISSGSALFAKVRKIRHRKTILNHICIEEWIFIFVGFDLSQPMSPADNLCKQLRLTSGQIKCQS